MHHRSLIISYLTAGALTILLANPVNGYGAAAARGQNSEWLRSPTASVSPLVLRHEDGSRWQAVIKFDSDGIERLDATIRSPEWAQAVSAAFERIPEGRQEVRVAIPPTRTPVEVAVSNAAGAKVAWEAELVAPRPWTIYLTQHTHTDIGYTRPQTEILAEHLRYLDYALDFCDLTDDFPDDARFRWTSEIAWASLEYLMRRPAAQRERLERRLREGRIELAGMYLNLSEIATENALAASLTPVRILQDRLGIPIVTAMQNDVNGAGWCLVDYFADTPIRYLNMGINKTRSLLPFDKPTAFWWESPAGKRMLAYRADHYMTGNFWRLTSGRLAEIEPQVADYLRSLEDRDYPFNRVGVQYSGYFTDNAPPSTIGSEVARRWNEKFVSPHLRIATASEFLRFVESHHADELPVHREAWPDWWTDGFGSAARETAAAREMHAAMQVNEALLAWAAMLGKPISAGTQERRRRVHSNLLFYDEHTFGAAESISDPLAENTQVQWGEKSAYVWTAVKQATLLREEAWGMLQNDLPKEPVPSVVVANSLNWDRSGLVEVFIDHEILPQDREFHIRDLASGAPILAQSLRHRAEGTYWAMWIDSVPAMGFKRLRIDVGDGPAPSPASESPDLQFLENQYYRIVLNEKRGAIRSLVDKSTGREIVDPASPWQLGQLVYEFLPEGRNMVRSQFHRSTLKNIQVKPGAQGPVWKSLIISADLEGCAEPEGVKMEIRLYETGKRVEFHYTVRKLPVQHAEAVYAVFPFRASDAEIVYEAQGGLVRPGEMQIPGSSSDWQTIQSFLAVRNADGQILWGSNGAPLVQLGDFNLGKWQPVTQVDRPHVFSWVMNNYWFTNFRAAQEGEFRWHYYLRSEAEPDDIRAVRFGWENRIPLAARVFTADPSARRGSFPALSFIEIDAPNVLLVNARPSLFGEGIILHLREIAGKPVWLDDQNVRFAREITRADVVNVLEEPLNRDIEAVHFDPYEVRFVRLVW